MDPMTRLKLDVSETVGAIAGSGILPFELFLDLDPFLETLPVLVDLDCLFFDCDVGGERLLEVFLEGRLPPEMGGLRDLGFMAGLDCLFLFAGLLGPPSEPGYSPRDLDFVAGLLCVPTGRRGMGRLCCLSRWGDSSDGV